MALRLLLHRGSAIVLSLGIVSGELVPLQADTQFGKRLLQVGACGGGAILGAKVGSSVADRVAQFEATRRNLSPAEADAMKTAFKIGFALALCGGGAAVAGTTYSKLSKRGKENREKELMAAVEDAQPRTYADPERPTLRGTLTPQPSITEGNNECRIVEDYLADEGQGDKAIVKYCRPSGGGSWKLDTL